VSGKCNVPVADHGCPRGTGRQHRPRLQAGGWQLWDDNDVTDRRHRDAWDGRR